MLKAGASFHDKNMVVKYARDGVSTGAISSLLSLKTEHVEAIIKQAKAGTLKGGKLSYQIGDIDDDVTSAGGAANDEEVSALKAENEALQDRMARLEAMIASSASDSGETTADSGDGERESPRPRRKRTTVKENDDDSSGNGNEGGDA